jgi:hypothetical protein
MPFSISDFRSQGLSGGGARPNLFEVQITKVGQGALTADLQGKNFTFLCKGAAIPAQTIGTILVELLKFQATRFLTTGQLQ